MKAGTRGNCSICGLPAQARLLCGRHYMQARRAGTLSVAPHYRTHPVIKTTEERFWAKVDKSGTSGCWIWTGFCNNWGYGTMTQTRPVQRTFAVHRFAYELLVGAIPQGLHLDHLCRNTRCVNPAHLEPVTRVENVMRGMGPAALNARMTHCMKGHAYTPNNTSVGPTGRRTCRVCNRERQAALRKRRLAL